jgi:hypothetical protein
MGGARIDIRAVDALRSVERATMVTSSLRELEDAAGTFKEQRIEANCHESISWLRGTCA